MYSGLPLYGNILRTPEIFKFKNIFKDQKVHVNIKQLAATDTAK